MIPARNSTRLQALFVFFWPFLYLHSFAFPVNGLHRMVGNDFLVLYFNYKVYLLDVLAGFRFPLWSPAEAAGYPFYSNPFTQAFYPLNLPLVLFYKLAGYYTSSEHQIFTIIGISIFASGLYSWLGRINSNPRAALLAALVMSVSFKVTEIMRFPNAVHTAAWFPWILYAMTRIMTSRSTGETLAPGALLCFFLVCLLTGGYPYYVYYSVFLFLPYLVPFLIRPLRLRLLGIRQVNWRRSIGAMILATLVAVGICSPYLLATKRLMDQTVDRAGGNYEYSVSKPFSFEDTAGSLVYPPAAQAEGWYFFSITALLMILLYLLCARADDAASGEGGQGNSPGPPLSRASPACKVYFVFWIAAISYISYGPGSYLFDALWRHFPGFSRLRVWGRLNIVLVPVFAWLLSLAYAWLEKTISRPVGVVIDDRLNRFMPLASLLLAYGAVLAAQLHFHRNDITDWYWTAYFNGLSSLKVFFLAYGFIAFASLFLLLAVSSRKPCGSATGRRLVLAAAALLAAVEMEPVGTRMWIAGNTLWRQSTALDVENLNADSFTRRRTPRYGGISLLPNFGVGVLDNWYFQRYVSFLKKTEGELEARNILLGVSKGRKIFFSLSIDHATVREFLRDSLRFPETGRLLSYNGDELRWEIDAPEAGYLSFIDNWDNGWAVSVDGRPAGMKLLFGTFKSVLVPAGVHRVTFTYRPALFSRRAPENAPIGHPVGSRSM